VAIDVIKIYLLYAIFLIMFFSYIKSFISKTIIALLGLGLVISLSVGTDIISFGMSDKVVAEVNNKEISLQEFNYFRKLKFSQLSKKLLSDKEALKIIDREIVNTIARRKVSSNQALSLGLIVSQEELKNKIKDTLMFKDNGQFIGFDRYKVRVKDAFGLKVEVFEQILKEEILTDKLESLFYSFVFVSDTEIKQKFINDSTKLNFYVIRSTNESYKTPNFNENEVKEFINSLQADTKESESTYRLVELDYKYITKDIEITKEDIDTFILNYSEEEGEISDEKVKELLKKRIAINLFPQKIQYFNQLAEIKSFDEILRELAVENMVRNINIDKSSKGISQDLINQIKRTDFNNQTKVLFSGDSILIVSKLNKKIFSKEEAISSLKFRHLDQYEKSILNILIESKKINDEEAFELIKGDTRYTYEFNYNLSLDDFNRILGSEISINTINEGNFIPKLQSTDDGNFVVFIEKIRRADSDFLLLDIDKIKKDISIPRKEKIYGKFLSEIFNNSTIKYNKKYIE